MRDGVAARGPRTCTDVDLAPCGGAPWERRDIRRVSRSRGRSELRRQFSLRCFSVRRYRCPMYQRYDRSNASSCAAQGPTTNVQHEKCMKKCYRLSRQSKTSSSMHQSQTVLLPYARTEILHRGGALLARVPTTARHAARLRQVAVEPRAGRFGQAADISRLAILCDEVHELGHGWFCLLQHGKRFRSARGGGRKSSAQGNRWPAD